MNQTWQTRETKFSIIVFVWFALNYCAAGTKKREKITHKHVKIVCVGFNHCMCVGQVCSQFAKSNQTKLSMIGFYFKIITGINVCITIELNVFQVHFLCLFLFISFVSNSFIVTFSISITLCACLDLALFFILLSTEPPLKIDTAFPFQCGPRCLDSCEPHKKDWK